MNRAGKQSEKDPADDLEETETVSLLDLLWILVKRRWLIIGLTGGVALITLALLFYSTKAPPGAWNPFPTIYEAQAKVLISENTSSSSVSSLLGQSDLGALSGLLGLGAANLGTTKASLAQTLVREANSIKDTIAAEFDFIGKYHIEKLQKTQAREIFNGGLVTDYDAKSGIFLIGYADKDPEFAAAIANRVVELLEQLFNSLTLDSVMRKKQYLEQSIAAVEAKADSAIQQLIDYQVKYGITGSSENGLQTHTGSTDKIAQIEAQIFSKQIELKLQREYLPETDPRIVRLKTDIEQMKGIVTDLKNGQTELLNESVASGRIPDVIVRYATLAREAEIQMTILTTLQQQLETAKLESMSNSRVFQVVDKAETPEVRSKPSRSRIALISVFSTFFLSVFASFIFEYFNRAGNDPIESKKIAAIKRAFTLRKKAD
jgi:tyrosine-protein kinase Etk/Wzc